MREDRLGIGDRRYLHHLSESGNEVARRLLYFDRKIGGSDVDVARDFIMYFKRRNYDAADRVVSGGRG